MTSITAILGDFIDGSGNETSPHAIIRLYAGPDAEHRAYIGDLTARWAEARELAARIEAGEPTGGDITPEIAAHVLFHFDREGGYPPSEFKRQLLLTIGHADIVNRALLRRAFPGYVDAFNLAQTTATGTATLQQIARRDES